MGHLQKQSLIVSQTDFLPETPQNNQLINLMVFVPIWVFLLPDAGKVEEAAENRYFCANTGPILL